MPCGGWIQEASSDCCTGMTMLLGLFKRISAWQLLLVLLTRCPVWFHGGFC